METCKYLSPSNVKAGIAAFNTLKCYRSNHADEILEIHKLLPNTLVVISDVRLLIMDGDVL